GPSANAGPDQAQCTQGASTAFPLNGSATGGLQPVATTTWSVIDGVATIDSPTSLVTTAYVSSATATLRLTVVETSGCTETNDTHLTVNAYPVCSISGPATVCPRSTSQYSATPGMASYKWTLTGNGSISGPTNAQNVSVRSGTNCGQTFSL